MGVENNIPEGWKEVPLKEILLKSNQGVNTTTEKVIYSTKGHGVVKAQDILERKINFSVSDYVDKHEYARLSTHVKPKLNDILYSNIGSKMGNAAKVKSDFQFIIAWNVLRLQINTDEAEVDFLVQLLNSKTIRRAICSLNSSSTMPFVSGGVIRLFEINLPPLPEQKAIAKVLTAFDDKIELLQAQNKTLEAMAQTIFKEWFGKYQIGDELPEGWRVGDIYNVLEVQYGYPFKSKLFNENKEGLPLIRIRDIRKGVTGFYTTEDYEEEYIIRPGDVLAGMDAVFEPYLWSGGKGLLNQRACRFIPKDFVSRIFVFEFMKPHLSFYEKTKVGTTVIHLGKGDLDFIETVIPDKESLLKFKTLSTPIEEKIINNQQEIQSLTKTRDILIPNLMSGQVRVNNIKQTADA